MTFIGRNRFFVIIHLVSKFKFKKISGPTAKYSAFYNSAYGYPLFKTHKLNNNQLLKVNILNIPKRFLQSAGDITTFRITAFLEMIFKSLAPIIANFG